jgi:hypothetical protein
MVADFALAGRPHGLHMSLPIFKAFMKDIGKATEEIGDYAEAHPLPENGEVGRGRVRYDNVIPNQQGNSTDYLARRIARDDSEEDGSRAVRLRMAKAAANTTGQNLGHGGDRKSRCTLHLETIDERAEGNDISRRTQIKLDRLAREAPEIHQLVARGELSVAAAERAAGFAKKKTPLEHLKHWWQKASEEDRARGFDL